MSSTSPSGPAPTAVGLLKWLVDRQITPHIPVWGKSARADGSTLRYLASKRDCDVCAKGDTLS